MENLLNKEESASSYSFTRFFLIALAIFIAISGALFIVNILGEVDPIFKYFDNYFHAGSSQGYSYNTSSNGSESLLTIIKLYIWISIIYLVVFWLSLISLPVMLSTILGKTENIVNEILLKVLGSIIVIFGVITFIFYLTYSDNFNNIEWIRNFRLMIGFIFLVFNCFHGFICIAVANIHEKYCPITVGHYEIYKEEADYEKGNSPKGTVYSPPICSNCGNPIIANDEFCSDCGFKL
jgi:hypothetical protein